MKENFFISQMKPSRGGEGVGGVDGEEDMERERYKMGEEIREAEVPSLLLKDREARENWKMLRFVIQEREPKMLFNVLIVSEYETYE